MGYLETLCAFDENQEKKELHVKKETSIPIEFDSPSLARKMTIDQGDNSMSDKKDDVYSKAESAKRSYASKSQLSVEEEKMLPILDDKSLHSKKASGMS